MASFFRKLFGSSSVSQQEQPAPLTDHATAGALVDDDLVQTAERLASAKQRHREGHIDEAEKVYRKILAENPGNSDARHMLGLVSMQKGDLVEAEEGLRQAIGLDGEQADYHSNLGNVLVAQERFTDALASFRKAIDLDPQHVTALGNCTTLLLTLARPGEAEVIARKLLQLAPDDGSIQLNLAAALMDQNRVREAIDVLKVGIEQNSKDVELQLQLVSALELVNELDEAFTIVQRVEALAPALPKVFLLKGVVLRRKGELELAEQHLRRAMQAGLNRHEQIEAYNQLGLTLDSQDDASPAFAAFGKSNQLTAEGIETGRADGDRFLAEVVSCQSLFSEQKSRSVIQSLATTNDFEPVFFVGFPRSGTTLMEQILKQHPKLVTTDEISPLEAVVAELRKGTHGYPDGIVDNSEEDWDQLRRYFQELCGQRLGDLTGKRVVDKLPLNVVHLGLASILFPKAKVVVALRDPRDACLSCYMQKFQINDAMVNFLDINSTARTYAAVMELWLQYREILQIPWMEYRYEDLVADFEPTVRQLLEFIGVGWDDSLYDYRDQALLSEVTTPSYRDVTAPINNHAVARWHKYEKEMASVLPALAPYVEKFGYDPT